MKIAVVGTGYVGLVTGTCFADMGVEVVCIDINEKKIEDLKKGILPIYEPGLEELVKRNFTSNRLSFSTDLTACLNDVDIVFSAVGTPPDEDGSADLHYVLDVARTIGKHMNKYLLVVTKSTVPVGTAELVRKVISEELEKRGVDIPFDIASNPEFLKEGAAIEDFMRPDRVVIGVESEKARRLMEKLYAPFMRSDYKMIIMDVPSAEMTKYAANAMLATRISFMNDIANLCRLVGADVAKVRDGIGSDPRIGKKFLFPGCGYGGSCFPKDVKALIKTAEKYDYSMSVLKAVEEVNENQKKILFKKLNKYYKGELQNKKIAVWGMSFKPETDDVRDAPSLVLIDLMLEAGCDIRVYDPIAMDAVKAKYGNKIKYAFDMYDAAVDADALLIVTEWKQFRIPTWTVLHKVMNNCVVFDGRNLFKNSDMEESGFEYFCI